jgi:hypothetical protein
VGYLAEFLGGPRDREVVHLDGYLETIPNQRALRAVGWYLPRERPDDPTCVLHYDWTPIAQFAGARQASP